VSALTLRELRRTRAVRRDETGRLLDDLHRDVTGRESFCADLYLSVFRWGCLILSAAITGAAIADRAGLL
jgi:hypothetical protein